MKDPIKIYDARWEVSEFNDAEVKRLFEATLSYANLLGIDTINITRDARLGSARVMEIGIDTAINGGFRVFACFDSISTPLSYYTAMQTTLKYSKTMGLTITASHNPQQYIGVKFTVPTVQAIGYDCGPLDGLKKIKEIYHSDFVLESKDGGELIIINHPVEEYIKYTMAVSKVSVNSLEGLTVVLDTLNGPAGLNYIIENISNAVIFSTVFVSGYILILDYGLSTTGSSNVTIRATDTGGFYVESTFNVKVGYGGATFGVPIIIVNTGGAINEGGTLIINTELLYAEDAVGGTSSLIYNVTQMPRHGTLFVSANQLNKSNSEVISFSHSELFEGRVIYTHDGSESVNDTIKFTVADAYGNTTEENIFIITISGVNDAPVVSALPAITMFEDVPHSFSIIDWYDRINDPDNADSTLAISISCSNENVILSTSNDKNYTITTSENYFGNTSLSVLISDGELSCGTEVTLLIKAVNDPPVINNLPSELTITSGTVEFLDLCNCISDIETPDSLLILSFEVAPDSVYSNYKASSGKLILWPVDSFYGDADITITVSDQDGGSASETILLNIIQTPTEIEKLDGIPDEFILYQNYPNPFNPTTTIRYGLPEGSKVKLAVFNMLGQQVAVLKNEIESAGYHEVRWDASNLASGVYLCLIRAESKEGDKNISIAKKLILLR